MRLKNQTAPITNAVKLAGELLTSVARCRQESNVVAELGHLLAMLGINNLDIEREYPIGRGHADMYLPRYRAIIEAKAKGRAAEIGTAAFRGPVEADETYVGGKRKNMPKVKREALTGRGAVGKTAVAGIKDRPTKLVSARVVRNTKSETMTRFIMELVDPGAKVYTDDALTYHCLPNHETVRHSIGEYVRGNVHTNGVESFWSMLKRAHMGTFHKIGPKHLQRYFNEFSGRHNIREADTEDQMGMVAVGMIGKRIKYRELIADNGLHSGARAPA